MYGFDKKDSLKVKSLFRWSFCDLKDCNRVGILEFNIM